VHLGSYNGSKNATAIPQAISVVAAPYNYSHPLNILPMGMAIVQQEMMIFIEVQTKSGGAYLRDTISGASCACQCASGNLGICNRTGTYVTSTASLAMGTCI
jgi:hypothetical protein